MFAVDNRQFNDRENGCGPEIDSWQGFLPTIRDCLQAQPNTDRIDTNTVAGIFVKKMARRYVKYTRC
jgi:hypothetical protein